MSVNVSKKEEISLLLNEWYQEIRSQNFVKAKELKQNIDTKIHSMEENQRNIEFYKLLEFRFKMLSAEFYPSQSNISFSDIKNMTMDHVPTDKSLLYYYHFFKASHTTVTGDFKEAGKNYEIAESLLEKIHDPLEKAEFNLKLSIYYYYTGQPILVIQFISRARKTFAEASGYERKVAACDNILGLAAVKLNEFEQAEIYFTSSLDMLQKQNEEALILQVRHSLGAMYAKQDLSEIAIRYLSEVSKKIPNHFRAIFLEAREHFKLGHTDITAALIQRGLEICNKLEQEEYKNHFLILKVLNESASPEQLEEVVCKAIAFFKDIDLWQYVQEYAELLAVRYYSAGNSLKASEYFYVGHVERKKGFKKGALK